jgi:hypothetical protein
MSFIVKCSICGCRSNSAFPPCTCWEKLGPIASLALETIIALQKQWTEEKEPCAVDIVCEMGEIALHALGQQISNEAAKAIESYRLGHSIKHWLP